jgi:predicted HD superfamily hydrolase involved in NAD metabolism
MMNIMEENIQKQTNLFAIQKQLADDLSVERYEHTLGVMMLAGALASVHGEDKFDAMLAGLLHDCAKCYSGDYNLYQLRKAGLTPTESQLANKELLHARTGALLAKEKYHVEDERILKAIEWHTTGRADMSLLEKIIFVADYIEPFRNKADRLEELRKEAFTDLDCCVMHILEDTVSYLTQRGGVFDESTKEAYEFYRK